MFKLYKKLRPIDWVLLAVLVGLTFLQVYCTMTLVDFMKEVIQAITYLDYHNNPGKLGAALKELVDSLGGWDYVSAEVLAGMGMDAGTVDRLTSIAGATTGAIWYNGGMMLLVALGCAGAQMIVGLIASYVSASLSTNIRSAVYKKVDSFSASEVDKFSTPSLITRSTNDIQQVQVANIMLLRMAVAAPITAVWAILKIRATSMQLTWATVVAVVLLLVCIISIMVVVMPKFKSMQKLTDKLNGVSRENLTGIRVVRAYNAEGYQEAKFDTANTNITKTQLFTGRVMALMSPVMMLIMNGLTLALYWIGSSLINQGVTDYPTVTSFMTLTSQIIMAFMMLLMMFVLLPRAQVSAERINAVLDTEVSIKEPETDAVRTEVGTVEFRNVTFRYPDSDEAVIRNISFKANKGDTVAFIGSTGSGKSTLINLVPRFFDVTEGQVLIDGANVRENQTKDFAPSHRLCAAKGRAVHGDRERQHRPSGIPTFLRKRSSKARRRRRRTDLSAKWKRDTIRIFPRAAKTYRADRNSAFPSRAPSL